MNAKSIPAMAADITEAEQFSTTRRGEVALYGASISA